MINYLWGFMIVIGIIVGVLTGRMQEVRVQRERGLNQGRLFYQQSPCRVASGQAARPIGR